MGRHRRLIVAGRAQARPLRLPGPDAPRARHPQSLPLLLRSRLTWSACLSSKYSVTTAVSAMYVCECGPLSLSCLFTLSFHARRAPVTVSRGTNLSGTADTSGWARTQSKSPTRAETRAGSDRDRGLDRDGENSPVRTTSPKQRRAFSPTRRRGGAAAEQETAASSLSPARPGRGQPAGGEVTGVVEQATHDAGAAAGAGSAENDVAGDNAATGAAPAAAAAAAADAVPVSEKVTGRAETKEVAAGTPQQQQQQQQQMVVSSSSAASSAAPGSVNATPLAPAGAAAAAVASPRVVERETTVSSRKRAAAAAKGKAREQEAAAAAVAAAEAKQQEGPTAFAQMSRAEKKSRQAVEKLGLRTVKGVFRMTMRTTNGVVFVVKAPDVFKHPQQVCVCVCLSVCLACASWGRSPRAKNPSAIETVCWLILTSKKSRVPLRGKEYERSCAGGSSGVLEAHPHPSIQPSIPPSTTTHSGLSAGHLRCVRSGGHGPFWRRGFPPAPTGVHAGDCRRPARCEWSRFSRISL